MSILRNKIKDRFVQVPNALVTDTRISIPARLVYVYLASKPDGWIVRNDDVKKSIGIKDNTAMAKYWKELEAAGWITRKKVTSGEYSGTYDYELQEINPIEENPNLGNSLIRENPNKGKSQTINNTDLDSNIEYLNSNKEYIQNAYSEEEKDKIQETCDVVRKHYPRCNYPILADRATVAALKRISKEKEIDIIEACEYLQERVRLFSECKYGAERQYLPEANNWLDNGGYDANENNWTKGTGNGNEQRYIPQNI